MNRHLTDDELIDQLYGVGNSSQHIDDCLGCAHRLQAMKMQHARAIESEPVPERLLIAQRQQVFARLSQQNFFGNIWGLKWAPAFAVMFLLAVGVFLYKPSSPVSVQPAQIEASDSQIFTDAYAMEETLEPRAAAPIRALFEEEQ